MIEKRKNFLPGPVDVPENVKVAFTETPISHRSPEFLDKLGRVKEKLSSMTCASGVEILMGSGTLANDAAAAQLSMLGGAGLIVTNGEFGERLVDHAGRFNLDFETINYGWGEPFDYEAVSEAGSDKKWLWAVHSETSTGVLNDLEKLKSICSTHGIRLALDCVSSIGTVPLELTGVYIATGVSGKGLRSYPGLAMVFHNSDILPTRGDIPRYLDLYNYSRGEGVPYTVSSNLVSALGAALDEINFKEKYQEITELSIWLRNALSEKGFKVLSDPEHASPSIVTIALPEHVSSHALGEKLEAQGYYIHHRSGYLESRGWVQIALMGECSQSDLLLLTDLMLAQAKDFKTSGVGSLSSAK